MDKVSDSPASLALMPSEDAPGRSGLLDVSFQLAADAGALGGTLQPPVRAAVGDLVRSMNCYYSNLIEGHDTLPRDIDRVLRNDVSDDSRRRNLQLEARAHIEVQAMVDHGELDRLGLGTDLILTLHREFCERLPEDLLCVESRDRKRQIKVEPGRWREDEVDVGRHVPPPADMIPAFMAHFAHGYAPQRIGRAHGAIAAAAAHHRLVWIHPFLDGNGRVARLYTHAYLRHLGIGSDLWSVSRGLARTVEQYKGALARADWPPQTMTDGRGTLSESGLVDFCRYFLQTSVDQVRFMHGLLDPAQLIDRLRTFVAVESQKKAMDPKVLDVLTRIVIAGELPKSELPNIMGVTNRHALRLVQPLIDRGLLVSPSRQAPYRMAFPLAEIDLIFPRLFAPPEIAMKKKVYGLDEPIRFAALSKPTTIRQEVLKHGNPRQAGFYSFALHSAKAVAGRIERSTDRYWINVVREGSTLSEEFDITKEAFEFLRGIAHVPYHADPV